MYLYRIRRLLRRSTHTSAGRRDNMLSCWRDNKSGCSEQFLQLIPSLELVFVFWILFGITAVKWMFTHYPPTRSLFICQIGNITTKLLFPKHLAFVACYAMVDRVAWIQSKAEAGGPRIGLFRRVWGDVTEIRSHCWRMRCRSNSRPYRAL